MGRQELLQQTAAIEGIAVTHQVRRAESAPAEDGLHLVAEGIAPGVANDLPQVDSGGCPSVVGYEAARALGYSLYFEIHPRSVGAVANDKGCAKTSPRPIHRARGRLLRSRDSQSLLEIWLSVVLDIHPPSYARQPRPARH